MRLHKEKLKLEMERQGLSYQALADMMKITRQAVGYYLNTRKQPNIVTINKIAKALKCDPKDLLI